MLSKTGAPVKLMGCSFVTRLECKLLDLGGAWLGGRSTATAACRMSSKEALRTNRETVTRQTPIIRTLHATMNDRGGSCNKSSRAKQSGSGLPTDKVRVGTFCVGVAGDLSGAPHVRVLHEGGALVADSGHSGRGRRRLGRGHRRHVRSRASALAHTHQTRRS